MSGYGNCYFLSTRLECINKFVLSEDKVVKSAIVKVPIAEFDKTPAG